MPNVAELIKSDLARLPNMVRAVALPCHTPARATWHAGHAFLGLLSDRIGGTWPRQGVPEPSALGAAPARGLEGRHVAGHVEVQDLATDVEAILQPNGIAVLDGALSPVESHIGPELGMRHVKELLRGLHRNDIAQNPGDIEFPGHRGHDLVVEVPHHPGEICRIHILEGVVQVALRTVHVELQLHGLVCVPVGAQQLRRRNPFVVGPAESIAGTSGARHRCHEVSVVRPAESITALASTRRRCHKVSIGNPRVSCGPVESEAAQG
mmetsp:Transcript_8197/g.17376  ORF Transcript_8197/g.17376 Transcript_8197/m.17376 type:complete len:266 (-) Transcript_8197:117-914(-)